MKCSICKGEIEKLFDREGKIVWEDGNSAHPLNDGRCCNTCNEEKVIPARLEKAQLKT